MFTIKATYRSETRKFSFPNSSFPTYTQINDQLYRFFPISSSYHLARLLFTQSPSAPFARILIGMEAHSEEEYERHVRPFRGRDWPGGLLRFTVYDDEVPLETPNDAPTQQGDEDVLMDNPGSPEGSRRRPRRHEHRNGLHHGPPGHHRDLHRRGDIPQWPRPRPTFLAPHPPPLPPPPPPPPPFFPPFFHLPSPPPPPPPPPPRSLHGSPGFVPPLPILCHHIPQPGPPLPNLPPNQHLSQDYSQPQSPPPTGDGNETPVQRYFRRRGLRSVASAPVLGPVLPVPPPPPPPPPPPRPVSLYGEIQIGDYPPIMRPNRHSVIVGDEMDEFYCTEARPSADAADNKGQQRETCCDVDRGKQEVTDIIRTFKTDIDRILSQSLGMEPADVWGVTSTVRQPDPGSPPLSPPSSQHTTTNQSQPIEMAQSAEPPSSADLVIHENVLCDMCREVIVGVRHKCLDCPDFDLCSTCLAAQPLNIGSHSRSHSLFAIEEAGGLWVHTDFAGGSIPEVAEPSATEGPPELPNTSPPPSGSDTQGERTPPIAKLAVHHATCDLCDCTIKGDRFKCFDCPDFDTCASCYAIVPSQHPNHSFARLRDPHDLKHPLFSPPLHRANCNECGKIIYGIRYKCMHLACNDFDLCASCEALPIPVHPTTHAMLKIREPGAYIPVVRRYGVQQVPTPVTSASPAQRSQKDEITIDHPQAHMNTNMGTIRFGQFDPDGMPSPTPLDVHLSEPPPKLSTELVDVSYLEPEHDVYGESPKMPAAFAFGIGDSDIPSPLVHYSIPTAAPLLPVPSPPPALATEFFHAVPSLNQNNESTEDLITGLRGSVPSSAPWWGPSTWVPPTPPAPLPVPLRTPSTPRRSQSPDLLVRFEDQGDPVIPLADTLPAATSLVPEFGRGPSPSLPHVPPVDFNELFDLASQFRHLLELPPVISPPSLPALPREMPSRSRAESIGEEEASAPTELASTQVDDAGTPLSLVALLSKPEKAPRPGVFDAISPGRLLSQLLDSTSTASLSPPVDKKKSVDEDAALRASFIADNNILDGQIFPPGAEFVKSWRMRNDGPAPWPADTELVFVAGDKLMIDTTERFKVGSVPPGEEVDVWTGEMKAPDVPGKYISYWRLCDNKGRRFGHSIWIDISVAESIRAPVPEEGSESLASSSVVMPHAAPSNPTVPVASHDESTTAPLLSDTSSVSLIDVLSDDDDSDSEVYEDSRSQFGSMPGNNQVLSPDVEYVVLSDDSDGL